MNGDIRPGVSTNFIQQTRPDSNLSGIDHTAQVSYDPSEPLDYAPNGLLTNEYQDTEYSDTAYSEDEEPWDWDEDDEWADEEGNITDRYRTDMMDTYGTDDLNTIKRRNRGASRFAGGDVNKWQGMRSNFKQGMGDVGQSLMDYASSSGDYEDSGMPGAFQYNMIR